MTQRHEANEFLIAKTEASEAEWLACSRSAITLDNLTYAAPVSSGPAPVVFFSGAHNKNILENGVKYSSNKQINHSYYIKNCQWFSQVYYKFLQQLSGIA